MFKFVPNFNNLAYVCFWEHRVYIYTHAHIYIEDYPSELYKKSRSFKSVFTCTLHFYNTLVVRELNYCKSTIENYLGMIKE